MPQASIGRVCARIGFDRENLHRVLPIVLGALALFAIGELSLGDALYFSFITGLTIGYGDILVSSIPGRIIAVLIGLVGILFTGMIVAAAVKAVQITMDEEQLGP